MLKISFDLSHVKYSVFSLLLYFAKYVVEDWFGCGELDVFCHISALCLSFNIKYK